MRPLAKALPISSGERLDARQVTFVYTMFHHLGDFVVMAGLMKKFDLLQVEFESLVAHRGSPHVSLFSGKPEDRFFDVAALSGFFRLVEKLRRQKRDGRLIFGLPMAPGSIQAHVFFQLLKKLGALTHIVDFNLINADVLTPPRRRYLFDRHLAQACEILKRPEWLKDCDMPLAIATAPCTRTGGCLRIGFCPDSARSFLPEFQWSEANWRKLADMILGNPDCEIAVIGRDQPFAGLQKALEAVASGRIMFYPCRTVQELLAALQEVDQLITLNSSALHLAHALKLPLVTLCGSSAEVWLPEGDHIRIVQDRSAGLPPSDQYHHDPLQPSLKRIQVEDVYAAWLDHFQGHAALGT